MLRASGHLSKPRRPRSSLLLFLLHTSPPLSSRTAADKSNTVRTTWSHPAPRHESTVCALPTGRRRPSVPASPLLLPPTPRESSPLLRARPVAARHGGKLTEAFAEPSGAAAAGRVGGGRRFLVPSFATACGPLVPFITDKARRALFPRVVDSRGSCRGGGGGLLGSVHPPGSRHGGGWFRTC